MKNEQYNLQREFMHSGYLVVPEAVPISEVSIVRNIIDELFENPTPPYSINDGVPNKLYAAMDRHEIFKSLVSNPKVLGVLEGLLGPNIVAVKNRHNHVSVNRMGDQTVRLHRDILNWSRGLVTAVFYFDDADQDNGATICVPGSHNLPYVGITQPGGGGTWMDEHEVYAEHMKDAVSVTVKSGDVLLFNSTLFHSVGENTSENTRRAAIFGYRSVDELDPTPNEAVQVLVKGDWEYRGNDRSDIL